MAKKLIDIIAENERLRVQQKNLESTDDVENSIFKEYANDFGEFAGQNYTNDTNFESPSVSDVGDAVLEDRKDLNVFPQDNYIRVDTNNVDASVIDMPEIEDISEEIYYNNLNYNKFVTFDYIAYEFQDAQGVSPQIEDYGSYIAEIKRNLETRGLTLADVFIGNFNEDDSPIGVIGGQSLNNALNTQFAAILNRETFGRINTQAFSVLQTGQLFRKDYDITVRKEPVARTLEILTELQGFEFPISYLPQDVFGLERVRVENEGKVTYVGSSLTSKERIALLLEYTGKGQQKHLTNLLKLNQYNPEIRGKFETIESNEYIRDYQLKVGNPNANDFIVTFNNAIDTGLGYYEPYGVVSIHKRTTVGALISDAFAWRWINDIPNVESIGWVTNNDASRFNSKSLLHKTQNLINGFAEGELGAFLDMSDKEFVEVTNGETYVISRGDATTASGDYTADDGTEIKKGEYFRVWTKNRGYNRLSRALRHRGLDNGDTRSVLNDNGLVNFAPTIRRANGTTQEFDDTIKRYMFSLENLAWNDFMDDLPLCEQGVGDPVTGTRGRIMWFPPYNLSITESSRANWESTDFIGRSEPIYTYNNSERTASISFTIIVDHPDIINRLVGQKTEFWERYFKGDKLVENEARLLQTLNKRLSQNEIDELEKRRKVLTPKEKVNDKENITPERKEEEKEKEVKKVVDDGGVGDKILSIYFPNNETVVPEAPFTTSLNSVEDGFKVNENLTLPLLKEKNIGYEDGGDSSNLFTIETKDGYLIETTSGIKYKKNGVAVNKRYTYNNGKLIDNRFRLCRTSNNPPRGYLDETNFGKNNPFYFLWKQKFFNALDGSKKVRVTLVGGASAAIPPQSTNNTTLASRRAAAAEEWFRRNVKVLMGNIGQNIVFSFDTTSIGDKESRGNGTCEDCSRPDTDGCKEARRVDIYIKVLEEDEPEPEPIVTPTGNTTIEEDEDDPSVTTDEDETNGDPDKLEPLPPIDPSILRKLVYTECDFFEYLEINEPTAYQTISERIKYFMPAYHSITPQGFNSRLTFLQQCLRQGDSIGRDGIDNWKNLAFGRPPVCILRIGDFYHTRIIIESLDINYDEGMQWDLNPEGIGVQPMYADITMSVKILGGSSMTAPINRLQNALSFNYYANTEMYDARADSVVFSEIVDENGNVDDTATFGTLKNGRIVDGIRLSSITNFSESERQQRLARIRKQSRITLQNSTDAQVPTEDISNLGQVESLLELKKRLGMPLTEVEKKTQAINENVTDKFKSEQVSEQTEEEVVNSIKESLFNDQSVLTVSAEELLEIGEETDRTVYYSIVDQFLSATVTDSDDIDEPYVEQVGDEYIKSLIELSDYFDNR